MTKRDLEPDGPAPDHEGDLRQRLVGAYRLDDGDERFMERLNDALVSFEEQGYTGEVDGSMPNLFVVGTPRSGTTLLVQLLASHLDVGWISNLAAAFWRAPCTGIRLHRRLVGDELTSSFHSRAGRTDHIAEPHEFGYFWTRLLGHGLIEPEPGHAIDWTAARRTLLHMNLAWDRPIVFKAFQLGFHMADTVAALPRSIFLRVSRDPVETALSIMRTRVAMTGSDETWISLRPRGWESVRLRSPAEQVAWQVLVIERTLTRQLEQVPEANAAEIEFDDLVRQPARVLQQVRVALADQGHSAPSRDVAPASFEAARGLDRPGLREEVEAAIAELRANGLEVGRPLA